jgi:hypothetical protein
VSRVRHTGFAVRLGFLLLVGAAVLAGAACGKKGPPLAPLQTTPMRIDDLAVRRLGPEVYIEFTIPVRNSDTTSPADVTTVEAYALTGEPVDTTKRPLDNRAVAKYGMRVGMTEVEPPPPPEERSEEDEEGTPEASAPPPPAPRAPDDPRPAQGEKVTFVEKVTPSFTTEFVPPGKKPKVTPAEPASGPYAAPLVNRVERQVTRSYYAMGRSRKGRLAPLSNRVVLPLVEAPPAPPQPAASFTATAVTLMWNMPPGARLPIQLPPAEGELRSRMTVPAPIPHTYNVYERPAEGAPVSLPKPINPQPLPAPAFADGRIVFGASRCYEVRTVEASGRVTVESPPSPPVCVTMIDTFPPAAPRGLAAVGSEGAINLIWEPNEEPDLAGYLVLRGEAGGTLTSLTPDPIAETTFRDAAITAGVRYVYAVVAVDRAVPRNVSPESNRVEETAR